MKGNLPAGWARGQLDEVLDEITGGGTPSKGVPEYFRGSIPLMTVKDMKTARPNDTGFKISEKALANSSAKLVPADTIIIATRMGLGKVVRPRMATAINQDLKALFPSKALDKSFLEQWLVSIASEIEAMGTGTTVKGVRLNQIRELEIPLPPLNEQRRIVEKMETLFARLDKGEESLRAVQKLLVRYRQSVLKAAVTGELTADWRAENAHRLEHGRELLERILKTRRENWSGRSKYKEPAAPDTSDLPELPEGWVWANGGQLFEWSSGKFLPNKSQTGGDTPVYGGNGINGYHDQSLIDGITMVVGRVGAHCGNVHLTNGPAWVTDNAIYAIKLPSECDLSFLTVVFRSANLREKSKGGAQPFVNQEALSSTLIPLPPSDEQIEIMARVDAEIENTQNMEDLCVAELTRTTALRQSILKDAFSGRLVDQDPNDEPACELLARIKSGQPATKKTKISKRKTKP